MPLLLPAATMDATADDEAAFQRIQTLLETAVDATEPAQERVLLELVLQLGEPLTEKYPTDATLLLACGQAAVRLRDQPTAQAALTALQGLGESVANHPDVVALATKIQNTSWTLPADSPAAVFAPAPHTLVVPPPTILPASITSTRITETPPPTSTPAYVEGPQSLRQALSQTKYANYNGTSQAHVLKLLQKVLNGQGFDAGTPDGVWGERTRRAIIAWYKSRKETNSSVPISLSDYLLQELMLDQIAPITAREAAPRVTTNRNVDTDTESKSTDSKEIRALKANRNAGYVDSETAAYWESLVKQAQKKKKP